MDTFGQRLQLARKARGPLCVGIDPHPGLLTSWGLSDDPAGLEKFSLTCAEAIAPEVSIVKPQSAFYERHGSQGIAVLERTIRACQDAGALVLLDVKRGDIGSTTQAYADAYLNPASPLAADAITASPYLGLGSLGPMFDVARKFGRGVFVLALTSNPEGAQCQKATTASGASVAGEILAGLAQLNKDRSPLGDFGAVVGATLSELDEDLRINGPLLAPGFGAQGGSVADVQRIFRGQEDKVLVSISRTVLDSGPSMLALSQAVQRLKERLTGLLY